MSAPDGRGAVLFPGQGAQELGMGLDVAAAEPAAAAVFDRAAEALGRDLRDVIAGDDKAALDRTDVCQPAILITSLAVMEALQARHLVRREAVAAAAGLSLGEYSALTWAGALTLEDAVRLVRIRGEAMQRASDERPSGMISLVGARPEAAEALCEEAREDGVLVVANKLAPGQIAIAGTSDALDRAEARLREHRIRKGVRLAVAGAFHSPCMASAADELSAALDDTDFQAPSIPVVMNVSAEPVRDPDAIRDGLKRQLTSPVLWQTTMEGMLEAGRTCFLEPAPGRQLTNMLKRYEAEPAVATCANADELGGFSAWPGDDG